MNTCELKRKAAEIAPLIRMSASAEGNAFVSFEACADKHGVDSAAAISAAAAGEKTISVEGLGTFTVTAPAASGALRGKIAIVTGSAQGFGAGIAEYLASEGACVAIVDMNADGARAEAETVRIAVLDSGVGGLSVLLIAAGAALTLAKRKHS